LACGDQRQLTGSGSALEALRDNVLYYVLYFTFTFYFTVISDKTLQTSITAIMMSFISSMLLGRSFNTSLLNLIFQLLHFISQTRQHTLLLQLQPSQSLQSSTTFL